MEQIYGKEAAKEGQAGPWLEKGVQTKETRIERMLNFLVQTDKIWDRQAMLETTRRVFLEMMAARESGNPADVPDGDLFPELAAHLKEEIARNKAQGVAAEFRNLCVRKVELILVRNFADKTQDEFVARVRAHAQKILRRNGQVSRQDEDVVPFEQYLTLGRLDNRWKLKEILSAEAGQAAVKEENLDQDSSPEQVQWYYQHGRAVCSARALDRLGRHMRPILKRIFQAGGGSVIKHAGVAIDAQWLAQLLAQSHIGFLNLSRRQSNALQPDRFVTGL